MSNKAEAKVSPESTLEKAVDDLIAQIETQINQLENGHGTPVPTVELVDVLSVLKRQRARVRAAEDLLAIAENEPEKLPELIWKSRIQAVKEAVLIARKRIPAKKCYDRSRRFSKFPGLIKEQFTGSSVFSLFDPSTSEPATGSCLDKLLAGEPVKMSRTANSLEQLFGIERHYLSKILRKRKVKLKKEEAQQFYTCEEFLVILDELLNEPPGSAVWLPSAEKRLRLLSGIVHRINCLDALSRLEAITGEPPVPMPAGCSSTTIAPPAEKIVVKFLEFIEKYIRGKLRAKKAP
jgi:hypothetical protein